MRLGGQQRTGRLGGTVRAGALHLRNLRHSELRGLHDAAAEAIECAARLADAGKNPVTEVLGGARIVEEWAHFPAGDVVDPATQSQFYYHAHVAAERVAGEHGHFHTFGRADGAQADALTHLIGISTDASGRLIRLFTTNRWVTGEVWHDADSVIRLLERFDITVAAPSRELNRWVSAVVRLFRPQIVDLVRARDATIVRWRAAHPGRDVFEDRELQVTSEMPVDFLAQVRAVEAALAAG
jgi:Domain of unknown function (DUF6969)